MKMNTIWKYKLDVCNDNLIRIPKDAKILTVQVQLGTLQLWACVDPDMEFETRHIRIYGIGQDVLNYDELKYISTFQLQNGNLIFHVFEVVNKRP